jgi:hypothetical protein
MIIAENYNIHGGGLARSKKNPVVMTMMMIAYDTDVGDNYGDDDDDDDSDDDNDNN